MPAARPPPGAGRRVRPACSRRSLARLLACVEPAQDRLPGRPGEARVGLCCPLLEGEALDRPNLHADRHQLLRLRLGMCTHLFVPPNEKPAVHSRRGSVDGPPYLPGPSRAESEPSLLKYSRHCYISFAGCSTSDDSVGLVLAV